MFNHSMHGITISGKEPGGPTTITVPEPVELTMDQCADVAAFLQIVCCGLREDVIDGGTDRIMSAMKAALQQARAQEKNR